MHQVGQLLDKPRVDEQTAAGRKKARERWGGLHPDESRRKPRAGKPELLDELGILEAMEWSRKNEKPNVLNGFHLPHSSACFPARLRFDIVRLFTPQRSVAVKTTRSSFLTLIPAHDPTPDSRFHHLSAHHEDGASRRA
jgi:hypothetical protein